MVTFTVDGGTYKDVLARLVDGLSTMVVDGETVTRTVRLVRTKTRRVRAINARGAWKARKRPGTLRRTFTFEVA